MKKPIRKKLLERIMALSQSYNLVEVNFFDSRGQIASTENRIATASLGFSNGEEFTVTKEEYKTFGDFKFKIGLTEQ